MKWLIVIVCVILGGIIGGFLTPVDWSVDPMGPWVVKVLGIAIGALVGLAGGLARVWIAPGGDRSGRKE